MRIRSLRTFKPKYVNKCGVNIDEIFSNFKLYNKVLLKINNWANFEL